MNNIQISKNFKLKKFECNDSGSVVKIEDLILFVFTFVFCFLGSFSKDMLVLKY